MKPWRDVTPVKKPFTETIIGRTLITFNVIPKDLVKLEKKSRRKRSRDRRAIVRKLNVAYFLMGVAFTLFLESCMRFRK